MMPILTAIGLETARAAVWLAILSLLFIPLERLFAAHAQPLRRPQLWLDLGYYLLNSVLTVPLLSALAGLFVVLVRHLQPVAFAGWAGALPLWARVAATLAVGELGTYWGHRWSHQVPLLWRFHAIHHSAESVDWLTSARGHPIDLVFTRLCGLILLAAFGLARPETGQMPPALLLASVFAIVWGYVVHANLRWRLRWLTWLIATPAFHRWHHSADRRRDRNFASTLPIYDRLFGTFDLPKDAMPAAYGIDAKMPSSLAGQLVGPLTGDAGPSLRRFSSKPA